MKTPRKRTTKLFASLELLSVSSPEDIAREATEGLFQPFSELAPICHQGITDFLRELQSVVPRLKGVKVIDDFVDACKGRFEDLYRLSSVVSDYSDYLGSLQISRTNSRGEVVPFLWKYQKDLVISNDELGEIWFQKRREPGLYRHLLVAALRCILIYQDNVQQDNDTSSIRSALNLLMSIGRSYEDIRGSDAYIRADEEKMLARFKGDHTLDVDNEWYPYLIQVLDDVRDRSSKPYISDISDALNAVDMLSPFAYDDLFVTFKSTGTSDNVGTIPGIYASVLESDPIPPEKTVNGYRSTYRKGPCPIPKVREQPVLARSVDQPKVARRDIMMGCNALQDQGSWFHNRMETVLNHMSCDCTNGHSRGVLLALRTTHPEYRTRNRINTYSFDVSKATTTLDMTFQDMVCEACFDEHAAEVWHYINTMPVLFRFSDGEEDEFIPKVGNHQGFRGSFPLFAMGHHILMRMVFLRYQGDSRSVSGTYRIAGDDSIVAIRDPSRAFPEMYKSACEFINWLVNTDKGILSYWDSSVAYAEFGKKRVSDGAYNTPIPIRILLRLGKDLDAYINYLSWISTYMVKISLNQLLSKPRIRRLGLSDEVVHTFHVIQQTGLNFSLNQFSENLPINLTRWDEVATFIAMFERRLQSSVLNQILPRHLKDEERRDWIETRTPLFKTKYESMILDHIPDERHKYLLIMLRNRSLINDLREFMGNLPPDTLISLELTSREISVIHSAMDILQLPPTEYGKVPDESLNIIEATMSILDRFQPMSDTKKSQQHAGFVFPVIDRYCQLRMLTQEMTPGCTETPVEA